MLRRILIVACLCSLSSALAQTGATPAQGGAAPAIPKPAPGEGTGLGNEVSDASDTQETNKQQEENKAKALRLLRRSHGLNEQLAPREKLWALSRQAIKAAQVKPEVGRAWADELFEAANDAEKPLDRVMAQAGAVRALTYSDPEHGLELLARTEPADASSQLPPLAPDPIGREASALFRALFDKQGAQIIPKLRAQARTMGEHGAYPYAAIATLVNELARKDKDSELAQSLFGEMTAFYEQNGSTPAADSRFANSLFSTAALLPRASVQEALKLLVKNVLSRQYDSQQHMTASYTTAGGGAQLTDPADVVLSRLAHLIRQYDPDLAAKLAEDRPQLGPLLAGRSAPVSISISSSSSGGVPASTRSQVAARQAQFRAMQQIRSDAAGDPKKAAALAQSLPDEAQVTALTSIAAASHDARESASLLEQADQVAQRSHDLRVELQAAIARAEAAQRSEDSAQLNLALQRGFNVANELFRKQQEEHPGMNSANVYLFTRLVRAGMRSNPDLVMGYIETMPWPYVKATLLVDAAEALLPQANIDFGGGLIR